MKKHFVYSGELHDENEHGHLCEVECCHPVYYAPEVDARIAELEEDKKFLKAGWDSTMLQAFENGAAANKYRDRIAELKAFVQKIASGEDHDGTLLSGSEMSALADELLARLSD